MTLKASHFLAAGVLAIAGMTAQAAISTQHSGAQAPQVSTDAAPSPSLAYAEARGLLHHESHEAHSTTILSHLLTEREPKFEHMSMEETGRVYTASGVSTREVYTIDLYVHHFSKPLALEKHKVYANTCTVTGDEITSEITYAHIDRPHRANHASSANENHALAVQAQQQCRILLRDGHLDAFKAFSLAQAGAE